MLKILIDRRLILEFFAYRDRYADDVDFIMQLLVKSPKSLELKLTDKAFSEIIFYQSKASLFPETIDTFTKHLYERNNIITIEKEHFEKARTLHIKDFESAIELQCALSSDCGAIVTLIPESYIPFDLPILSVGHLIKRMRLEEILNKEINHLSHSIHSNHENISFIDPLITNININSIHHKDLRNRDISGIELKGEDFSDKDLSFCILENSNLRNCKFRNTKLFKTKFRNANLENADFTCADLEGADLVLAKLNRANLVEANLIQTNFANSQLNGANLRYSNLSFANLMGAELRGADLYAANLYHADLSYCNLKGSNFMKADFSFADLSYANLSFCDTRDAIFTEIINTNTIWRAQI